MQKKEDRSFLYIIIAIGVFAVFFFSGGINPFAVAKVPVQSQNSDVVQGPILYTDIATPLQQPAPFQRPTCTGPTNVMNPLGGAGTLLPFPAFGYDWGTRWLTPSAYHIVHNSVIGFGNRLETEDSGRDLVFNTGDDRRRLPLTRMQIPNSFTPVAHGRWAIYDPGIQTLPPPYPQISTVPLIAQGFGGDGIPMTAGDEGYAMLSPATSSLHQDDKDVASNNRPSDAAIYLVPNLQPNVTVTDSVAYHQAGQNLRFEGWAPPTDDVIAVINHVRQYSDASIVEVKVSWSGKFVVLFGRTGRQSGGFFVFYDVGPDGRYNGGPSPTNDDAEYVLPSINQSADPYVTEVDLSPDGRYLAYIDSYFGQNNLNVLDIGPNGRIDSFGGTDDSNTIVVPSQFGVQSPRIDGYDPVDGQTSRMAYISALSGGSGYNFVAAGPNGRYGSWPQPNGPNDDITYSGMLPQGMAFNTLRIIRDKITFESGNGLNEIACI